jgi:hypothetical protein
MIFDIEITEPDQPSFKNTPKKLYSYIKSQKNENTGIAPLRSEGTLHSHPSEKANILSKQGYRSVVTWVVFISFFENRRDICVVPVRWYFACFQ